MGVRYSSVGTKFYHYVGTTPTLIPGLQTKPAMPGLPNRLDATAQEDTHQRFIDGVVQVPDFNFQFIYELIETGKTNYKVFKDHQTADTPVKYGIAYPDGQAIEFTAIPFLQRDGTGVSSVDTFTVAMQQVDAITEKAAPGTIAPPVQPPAGSTGT